MQFYSTDETVRWCNQHRVRLDASDYPDHSDSWERFDIPADAGQRVALVSHAMYSIDGSSPILVFLNNWSVWPSGQRMHIFDRFRMSYGETRPVIDAPGHVFEHHEIEDAISYVTLAVLFLWDCHVVTPERSKLIFFSHDEWGVAKGIDMRPFCMPALSR